LRIFGEDKYTCLALPGGSSSSSAEERTKKRRAASLKNAVVVVVVVVVATVEVAGTLLDPLLCFLRRMEKKMKMPPSISFKL